VYNQIITWFIRRSFVFLNNRYICHKITYFANSGIDKKTEYRILLMLHIAFSIYYIL